MVMEIILNSHHQKVAYISYRIAQELQLPSHEIKDIVLAALLHDMGYKLLKDYAPLAKAAKLIKYHHTDYENSRGDIPLGSCIIHLADRLCVLFDEQHEIKAQVPQVLERIAKKNHKFHPVTLNALGKLIKLEYFWGEVFAPG